MKSFQKYFASLTALKNPFILLLTFWKRPWGHTLYPKGKKLKPTENQWEIKVKYFFQL